MLFVIWSIFIAWRLLDNVFYKIRLCCGAFMCVLCVCARARALSLCRDIRKETHRVHLGGTTSNCRDGGSAWLSPHQNIWRLAEEGGGQLTTAKPLLGGGGVVLLGHSAPPRRRAKNQPTNTLNNICILACIHNTYIHSTYIHNMHEIKPSLN